MKQLARTQHQQLQLWWWALLALAHLGFSPVASLSFDGGVLLKFKAAMHHDPQGILSSWDATDPDPCLWRGVSCSKHHGEARVTALSITRSYLVGSIPPELGSLAHLRRLNLHHNQLYGAIPPQFFNASQLQSLVLLSNRFSGALPQEIGRLTQLQYLDLSHNALAGSIPEAIADCEKLEWLILSSNNFSGPIPMGIGSNLTSLKQLDLSSNSLGQSIPTNLGDLTSLRGTLNLSHNQLSGSIPASLGTLPVNVSLDLTNNNLTGPIPQNGSLTAQGPTAFLGNPGLCGVPLHNPCSSIPVAPPLPTLPSFGSPLVQAPPQTSPPTQRGKGLSRGAIAAIAMGDAAGIALVGLAFLYCYWRSSTRGTTKASSSSSPEGASSSGGWFCRKNPSETPEKVEQGDLVALDSQLTLDLDDLLQASAHVLGKSGVGIVYRVIMADGLTLAVRRLGEGGSPRFKEFQTEVEAIGRIRHPNIVSLRAYYWAADEKLLIYDYIPNGSMVSALHGQSLASSEPLQWPSRLRIAKGAARGLAYLHQCNNRKYVHGDIKPSNILLDSNMEPYIADFGLNRLLNIAGSGLTPPRGKSGSSRSSSGTFSGPVMSPDHSYYQAPEAAKSSKPTQKWDVYSFGSILLELLTGKSHVQFASSDRDLGQWVKAAIEETEEPLQQIIDPVLVDEMHRSEEMRAVLEVALACVAPAPDQRPTMKQVTESLDRIG